MRDVQAFQNGGFDFVLLHPEYLRDRSGSGLLAALRQNGIKVAAFGWEPSGFVKEVIEGANVDGYIMGPGMDGVDPNSLLMLVARMQGTLNKFAVDPAQIGMTMGGIPVCESAGAVIAVFKIKSNVCRIL